MKQSLNFNWGYMPDFKEEYLYSLPYEKQKINIPHTQKEVPYNYFNEITYQLVSTYEKIFNVQNYKSDRRYYLRFDGFMLKAAIYLNGSKVGEYVSGYIPITIEVTNYVKERDNRLLVVLDSHEDNNYPPFGFAIDYVTYSGIYREVYLISEPKTHLKDIYVHGDIKGNITIDYEKVGEDDLEIEHELYFKDELITSSSVDSFSIASPNLWDLDNPNLYTLKTIIKVDDEIETYETRFGFRDIRFDKTGFYLNNNKVKLIGLNRHQGYPYIGYAASKSLQEEDANILKNEVGVNVVRTSHYPQSEHFLNRCDEIGLLVINEIPGWQHIGESEAWKKACINNAVSMVKKERNHPCLIAHGVRIDESIDDHDLYLKTNEAAHKLDKYRPTIGVRNFIGSELLEDIYGYNDFICDSLNVGLTNPKKQKVRKNKAILVTEYMGHMDPLKATSDQQKKIEVALRHAKVIDDNFKYDSLCGAIGWCFVDYHTHVDFGSGDHICPHGVMDMYRNPKYSSYIYASQQEKTPVLKVLSNMKPGDVPEAIFNDIYVATNCDYIELYKDDEFVERFYPKHEMYKYLKHPPILIDDIVGETFKEDKFPTKIHKKIAKMFSYAAMHGFNHLPLKMKMYLAYCMIRYKMNYSELVHYWNKYVGAWGGKAKTYKFKGYIDKKVVKEASIGPSNSFDLKVTLNKTELINEDTYDTLRIKLEHIDNHGNLLDYSSRIVKVSVEGPVELIGPKEQVLLGGQLSLYVKSKDDTGKAKINIEVDDIKKSFEINVKKEG